MPGATYIVRSGVAQRRGRTDVPLGSLFVPGVTWPEYTPTADFTGGKNVGNFPEAVQARTAYPSTVTNGVTNIGAGTYNNYNFYDTVVNITSGPVVFNNCRFYMSPTSDYIAVDSIRGLVRNLNGTCSSLTFNDCELHCRTQRVMNCFMGRNATFNRCVLSGGVDGPNDSASGTAPQVYGIIRNDCWIGEQAWWRATTLPWEGHGSDKQTHNDSSQVATTLGNEWHNCTMVTYASPFVGLGTPNAGSDTGNSYVPSSGTNYIRTQALQNADRATYLNYTSHTSQAYLGVARKLSKTSASPPDASSWANIMANRNGGIVDKVQFSGGTASINIMDPLVTGSWSIKKCLFWNDMVNGPGGRWDGTTGDPSIKGYAIQVRSGLNGVLDIPTTGDDRNLWSDGTTVTVTYV
jgi:hypothetical protein